jgi:hypothetical protein
MRSVGAAESVAPTNPADYACGEEALLEEKRVAITLTNGRSHVLDVPDGVPVEDAAAVIRGERNGSEVGWEQGDGDWLPFGNGFGWAHRSAVAEIAIVDYAPEEPPFGDQIYG